MALQPGFWIWRSRSLPHTIPCQRRNLRLPVGLRNTAVHEEVVKLSAVVSALARELKPLVGRVSDKAPIATRHGRFVEALLGNRSLILGSTGDGRVAAEDGLRSLLDRRKVDRLILVGVAGGLAPALQVGQLVVAGEVRDAGGPAPMPDPILQRRALAAAEAVEGTIYSSDVIVATAAAKARLWHTLDRPSGAVVDLETAAWARVAAERGVPYVAVRAISDTAGDDLPLDFELFRDRRGQVSNRNVAFRAALQPSLVKPLLRLSRHVDSCAGELTSWVLSYLD